MKTKKNILIVSPSKVGLTETFIRAHIERLDGNVTYLYGYALDFKTDDDINLKDYYAQPPSYADRLLSLLPHYLFFRINIKRQKEFTREALIQRFIQENKIDVVLAEYGTSGSFITPICKALNVPLIVHFHGFDASKYRVLEEFKDGYRLMYDYAFKIIVVSNAMKRALSQNGCKEEKLALNTYGPHSDYLNVNVDYKTNNIIAVGRHTFKKAPYLTILAFQRVIAKHPNLILTMVGTGELYGVSKHLISSLGLENKIILTGGLPRPEIIKYLRSSFLYIQHSVIADNGDSEGTPVGIIEAMAAGLSVVSTRHAGIPDVVIENETGFLVDEGDIVQMANHIIALVEDRNLAAKMGANGRQRIVAEYSMDKHIELLNEIIREL
jgi:glycosyltransferase involved in cell wall biosynthesis